MDVRYFTTEGTWATVDYAQYYWNMQLWLLSGQENNQKHYFFLDKQPITT